MALHDAIVLDIGQSVIHEGLSLSVLIEIPSSKDSSVLMKEVLYCTHALNLQVKFQPISQESYLHWADQQGKPRHIVTLLAREISAEHIARVTHITAEQGLQVDNVSRLSGRIPLSDRIEQTKACVEFSVRGTPKDAQAMRAQLTDVTSELGVDIAFQQDDMFRRTRRLVCFDMDSTLIEAEVIDELAKAAGVGDEVIKITDAAMAGELDFNESFAKRLGLLKGLDESVLKGIAESLPVTEGAAHLISTLRKLGYKTAILSGGFNYFGRYLQDKLGIDYVYANELEVVDGKVTGQVCGTVVNGERKAELLKSLAEKEGISLQQVIAVGDGANDLPMLSVAGLGIAFRAKPKVRAEAKQAISTLGLDAILYLLGYRDRELETTQG